MTAATSSSDSAPCSIYTFALRTSGRSPWLISWMHSLAESARWSNWPGRYSTANTTAPAASGISKDATSDCGSLNTVGTHCAKSSSEMPSTS